MQVPEFLNRQSYLLTLRLGPRSQSWPSTLAWLRQAGFEVYDDYAPVPDGEGNYTFAGRCPASAVAHISQMSFVLSITPNSTMDIFANQNDPYLH